MMRRWALRAVVSLTVVLCLALSAWTIHGLQRPPLSATEARLVGNWRRTPINEKEQPGICSFGADNVFRHDDGLIGRWWVEDEQLHLRYWSDREASWPFAKLFRTLRGRLLAPTEKYGLSFDDGEDRDHVTLTTYDSADTLKIVKIVFTRVPD